MRISLFEAFERTGNLGGLLRCWFRNIVPELLCVPLLIDDCPFLDNSVALDGFINGIVDVDRFETDR